MTRISILGPKGTFSEIAVKKFSSNIKESNILFCKNIREVFESLERGETEQGVIPIENMLDGSVGETLDLLYHKNLYVTAELIIPIHMHLAVKPNSELKNIKLVLSKDKALNQCLNFLRKNKLETKETLSTAEAMKIVSKSKDLDLAAIGTELAAKQYNLKIMKKNIEDNKNNVTRFFVISKQKQPKQINKEYKTSITIHPKADRPGLLHDLLEAFSKRNINLTKIESRPTKLILGEYIFYIDFLGHEEDDNVRETFKELKNHNNLKIFGSYERAY